jgi:cobyrinic acid a,c-diamide synthase
VVTLPRIVIAAPGTGHGKTTVATGLMAAYRHTGLEVSGHKVGPDYIDPGYHALATGRPARNLDPHLVGEERIVPLLRHGARGADLAVIEGVMGLYDGRLGTDGFASTAHVAHLTRTPVVLVVDVSRSSRTVGALVAGLTAYDERLDVVGVILNRARRGANLTEIERAVRAPVLGALPPDDRISAPSRHLGLVPAVEREGSADVVARLGEQVARHLDLAAILEIAHAAPALEEAPWDPRREIGPLRVGGRPVVAVAGGRAFTFRYPETDELLAAAGCDVVTFDPLTDTALPAGTQGLYLGGGFPETYAHELAQNHPLLDELRGAVAAGIPTVAECAGLLYLADSLEGLPMAGAIPASAEMTGRLTLRYPEVVAAHDSLLTRAGERVTAHEFHRTTTTPAGGARRAWRVDGDETGYTSATLHASYLHVHWAGHPHLARRFAEAVAAAAPHRAQPPARASVHALRADEAPEEPVRDPLRHHGDAEVTPDVEDFAVNVFAGPRPRWLDDALRSSLEDVATYPDPTHAREVLAQRHGRRLHETLPTAGAAEAFTLLARLQPWRRPVVVHPQFTEPHAALTAAGHAVTTVLCRAEDGFALDPAEVPDDADLVFVGNPTNPTGVLHPAAALRRLRRPGRLVVVDEAFIDAVPGEAESLARDRLPGVVVLRSLTKHWAIPGVRAGYVVGDASVVRRLAALQTPWSVSTPAIAAMVACASRSATPESRERVLALQRWRRALERGLTDRGLHHLPSAAPFVLARLGAGAHRALRRSGFAVRRADTFPGLDDTWVRIAVRPETDTRRLLAAVDAVIPTASARTGSTETTSRSLA